MIDWEFGWLVSWWEKSDDWMKVMYFIFVVIIWEMQIVMSQRALRTPILLCLQEQEAVNKRLMYHFVVMLM